MRIEAGQVAVVTGGTSGIGFALAVALMHAGRHACGRDQLRSSSAGRHRSRRGRWRARDRRPRFRGRGAAAGRRIAGDLV